LTRQAAQETPRSVLIVDESEESREVLRTILTRQGFDILEASRASEGLEILQQRHPNVVVADLEAEQTDQVALQDAYQDETRRAHSSLVFLGRVSASVATDSDSQVIAKPYHYGPLIRTIEQLLERC
jgi:PleD family two-component response regulator